jgi:ABC-type glutathione transport system ATPase component
MEERRQSVSAGSANQSEGAGDGILRRLSRTFSGKSHHHEGREHHDGRGTGIETIQDDDSSEKTKVEEWRLESTVKEIQQNDPGNGRSLGVTWKDLTVKVVPSDSALQENVLSQFNKVQQSKEARRKPALKTILDSSFGCVKPGEMLLVLGRPGSGCTTLLKMLANKRKGYEIMNALGGTRLFNLLTDYQIRRRRWTSSLRNP